MTGAGFVLALVALAIIPLAFYRGDDREPEPDSEPEADEYQGDWQWPRKGAG